jgi:hypothetical protein
MEPNGSELTEKTASHRTASGTGDAVGEGARAEGDGEAEATSGVIWRALGMVLAAQIGAIGVVVQDQTDRQKKRAKRCAEAKRTSQKRAIDRFFKEHRRRSEAKWKDARLSTSRGGNVDSEEDAQVWAAGLASRPGGRGARG